MNTVTSEVKYIVASTAKEDFEEWLTEMNYAFIYESAFNSNGEYRPLQINQFRIVFRTGIHNIFNSVYYDYHFWYQTHDGTWANKHGTNAAEHLEEGVTPYTSNSSGWSLEDIECFYDGPIYAYIITLN